MANVGNTDELWEQLATQEPVKTDDSSNGDSYSDDEQSLEDYERDSPNLSDLQYMIKTLSPDFKDDVYNLLVKARLSPDTFKPLLKILVNDEIRRNRRNNKSIAKTVAKVYTVLTMALDGKHIIDLLEAFGSKADSSDLDAMNRGLGLGG